MLVDLNAEESRKISSKFAREKM
jgi:hypothetical protein